MPGRGCICGRWADAYRQTAVGAGGHAADLAACQRRQPAQDALRRVPGQRAVSRHKGDGVFQQIRASEQRPARRPQPDVAAVAHQQDRVIGRPHQGAPVRQEDHPGHRAGQLHPPAQRPLRPDALHRPRPGHDQPAVVRDQRRHARRVEASHAIQVGRVITGRLEPDPPAGDEVQGMLPTGLRRVDRPVAGAAVIRAEVPDLEVQVRRAQGRIADRADDVPHADALADAGEEVIADRLHVPVKRVEHAPIREAVLHDHDAFFCIPAFRVGVGHAAVGHGIDRIAIAVEGQVDAGMQPVEAAPVQGEVIAAAADVLHRVADAGHNTAVGRSLAGGGRDEGRSEQPGRQRQQNDGAPQGELVEHGGRNHGDQRQPAVSAAQSRPIIWSAICRRRMPSGPSPAQASAARPPHTRI